MKIKYRFLLKKTIFYLSMGAIAIGCCIGAENSPSYNRDPHFILSGKKLENQPAGIFEYYLLTGGTYAVGLTTAAKNSVTTISKADFPDTYPGTQIPVTGIWANGFSDSKVKSIDLRESNLEVIDYEAFLNCTSLTSITIPWTVNKIGEAAFYNCTSITSVRFDNDSNSSSSSSSSACSCYEPSQTGETGEPSTLSTIPAFCFFNCYNMTDLLLNSAISDIEPEAFNGCYNLKSTLAFQNIKNIRSHAFQGCTSLRKIYMPADFIDLEDPGIIEPYAFNKCDDELTINFYGSEADIRKWINDPAGNPSYYSSERADNSDWGLYNEIDHSKRYGFTAVTTASKFDGDWEYTYEPDPNESGKYNVKITKYTGSSKMPDGSAIRFLSVPDNLPLGNSNYRVREISVDAFDSTDNVLKNDLERLYLPTTLRYIEEFMFDESYPKLTVIDSNLGCKLRDMTIDTDQDSETYGEYVEKNKADIVRRIKLDDLDDLWVIRDFAFMLLPKFTTKQGSNPPADAIEELYLPSGLKAVGNCAFGSSRKDYKITRVKNGKNIVVQVEVYHARKIKKFKWKYDENNAKLVAVGFDSFFKLGGDDDGANVKSYSNNQGSFPRPSIADERGTTTTKQIHEANRLILPRTFKHTGFTAAEAQEFGVRAKAAENTNKLKGEHAFAGCPLISEVIIKGSTQSALTTYINAGQNAVPDPNVTNLVLAIQTFAYCESLRKVIIEERAGREIFFHTNKARWGGEPCIGWNSGRLQNDFSSDPFLQIMVLPNQYTTLVVQDCAFQANSRASIYFTGSKDDVFANDAIQDLEPSTYNNTTFVSKSGQTPKRASIFANWKHIGEVTETTPGETTSNFYIPKESNQATFTNKYGIKQTIPVYENVHYEQDLDGVPGITDADVKVGVGCANDLVIVSEQGTDFDNNTKSFEKYALVCDNSGNATFSKYLYDRHNKTFSGTARIPSVVTKYDGITKCVTNKIGDSAFSTAFTDENLDFNIRGLDTYKGFRISLKETINGNQVQRFKELEAVEVPDTIEEIGEYAFFRAYGVKKITAYSLTNTNEFSALHSDYTMPSSLGTAIYDTNSNRLPNIGKHAFAFCNIEQFLGIPDDCLFYESTNAYTTAADYTVTSVFSNNFSLRKITFAPHQIVNPNNAEEMIDDPADTDNTSSSHYETTTYVPTADANEKYTCALYQSNAETATNRKLLLVLNRNSNDRLKTSEDVKQVTINDTPKNEFDGLYGQTEFLYGAYKMGYWIESLVVGKPTKTNKGAMLQQPLFSGIDSTDQNKRLYLYFAGNSNYYYSGISNLESVSLHETIPVDFQEYAFNGCNKLTRIKLPYKSSGLVIPKGLFATTQITKFITPISINPTTYDIDSNYTNGKMDLTYTGCTEIMDNAFNGVTTIKELIAPSGQNFKIGGSAFKDCTELKKLDFSGLTGTVTIGSSAFENCSKLEEIKFNASSTVNIGSSAFKNATIKDSTGTGFTWPTSANKVTLGESAFSGCKFESTTLTLPTSLKSIDKNCFSSCTDLTSINTAGTMSLTTIGTGAFSGCTNLTTFDLHDFTSLTKISDSCFSGCSKLDTLTTTAPLTNLTSFGSSAFSGTKFTSFDFENFSEVTTIGSSCFKNCTSLATVNSSSSSADPTKVTTIGDSAFEGCTALTGFDFDDFTKLQTIGSKAFYTSGNNHPVINNSGVINLPSTLTSIGSEAFENSGITIVNIDSSTLTIGSQAFKGCSSLTKFYFNNGNCLLKLSDSYGQFDNCTSLTELWLPSNNGSGNFNISSNASSIINGCYYNNNHDTNIVIYTHQTFTTSRTQAWRFYYGNLYAPISYYAPNSTALLNGTSGSYTLATSNTDLFWTTDNGVFVNLGYATSTTSAGVVTFSSGYTLAIDGTLTQP